MSSPRIGIDRRRDGVYLVRLNSGQPDTPPELHRLTDLGESRSLLDDASRVCLAVPDCEVQVKTLHLPVTAGAAPDDVIRFELAESLLEDVSSFQFETLPAADEGRHLGLIYRKERLDQLAADYGLDGTASERLSCQSRALALGRGYLEFCERATGDFLCVVDVAADAASVCFLLKDAVADLAHIDLRNFDPESEKGRRQFAVDLKTIVNFRRALLMDRGITLPLSGLVLAGDGVDDEFRSVVREYFPTGVEPPRLRPTDPALQLEGVSPEAFLVALGLAAN
jgi:hypothetical protein